MKLQIRELDGSVLGEKEIKLTDKDLLVMSFDPELVSYEQADHCFRNLVDGIENGATAIGIVKGIEFQVIKKEKERVKLL